MEAAEWYGEQSPRARDGFFADLRHAVQQIQFAPTRWPPFLAGTRRYVFRKYPFSLVYREYVDLVRILAVAHDSRRAGYWASRLDR